MKRESEYSPEVAPLIFICQLIFIGCKMQEEGVSFIGEVNYQNLEYLTRRKKYEHMFKKKVSNISYIFSFLCTCIDIKINDTSHRCMKHQIFEFLLYRYISFK